MQKPGTTECRSRSPRGHRVESVEGEDVLNQFGIAHLPPPQWEGLGLTMARPNPYGQPVTHSVEEVPPFDKASSA